MDKEKKPSITELFLAGVPDGLEQPTPVETPPDAVTTDSQEPVTETPPLETVEIDGKSVKFYEAEDGVIEYEEPEGYAEMDEATQAKFNRKAEESGTTLAKLKAERMQQNNKDKEIAELKAKLARQDNPPTPENKELEATADPSAPKKYWGVDTWAEVTDLQSDDPEKHAEGLSNMASDKALAASRKVQEQQSIRQKIETEGIAYDTIVNFAKDEGIGSLETALKFYKLQNGNAKPGTLASVRRKAAITVSPSNRPTPPRSKTIEQTVNDLLVAGGKP